jgi:hypothetical protein
MKLKCCEVKFAAEVKGAARYREGRASSGNVKQDTVFAATQSTRSSRFLKANLDNKDPDATSSRPPYSVKPAGRNTDSWRWPMFRQSASSTQTGKSRLGEYGGSIILPPKFAQPMHFAMIQPKLSR